MYTSSIGNKYPKARESRNRNYPDTDKIYEHARQSVGGKVKSKALEGKKKPFKGEEGKKPTRKWENLKGKEINE